MSDTQQVLTVEEQLRKALLAIVERAPSTKPEPPIDDWGHYRGSGNEGDIADHVRDWERWEAAEIAGGALFDTRPDGAVDASPKFDKTWCSNCGREFGPGDHGYSHCDQHTPQKPEPSPSVEEERKRGRIPERGTDARDDYYYGLGLQAGAAAESHGEETSFTKIIEDATREPSPSGSETGWVIERGNSDPSEPKYWAAGHSDADRMIAWTSNHMAAIRFSRREDAEAVWKRLFPDIQVRICDHAWGAPPSPSVEPPQSSYADLVWLKCLAEDDNPLINPRVYRSAIRQAATAIETLSQKLADQHARLLNTNDMFDKELDSLRAENERLRRTLTKIDKKIAIAAAMDNHWKELISDVQMLARAALKGTRIMKTVREVIAERLRADGEINGCPPGTPLHDWFGDANSILSALKEAGYAVVPVEPSSPMQAAGSGALGIEGIKSVTSYGAAGRAYVAMVAASQDQGRE